MGKIHARRYGLGRSAHQAVRQALAIPLLYKLLVANSLLTILLALLGSWLVDRHVRTSPNHSLHWELFLWFGAVALVAVVLVNYGLLRAALQPLASLRHMAYALRRGDTTFQLARPLFSDPDVDRLLQAVIHSLKELGDYRQRLRDFSSRVSQQLETQRESIARELHDDIYQNLAALLVLEQMLAQSSDLEEVKRLVGEARELTRLTLESVRRLSLGLRPAILDQLGLPDAMRWYVEEVVAGVLPPVILHIDKAMGRLPPVMEVALFRIAQEALSNAARHAQAGRITLGLRQESGWVELWVADDGLGFDTNGLVNSAPEHLGLFTMQERARLLGGSLEVHSAPGNGTTVVARLPLASAGLEPCQRGEG